MSLSFYEMECNVCTIISELNCGPCVHKSAVAKYHNVSGFSVLPSMDPRSKALYHYIADGRTEDNIWYRPLNQPDARPNISDYIEDCSAPTESQNVTGGRYSRCC